MNVAQNPNAPIKLLEQLAKDEDYSVRNFVAQHPNAPVKYLEELAQFMHSCVQNLVGKNPNAPVKFLKQLAQDKNYSVRKLVAENPNAPVELLEQLAQDRDSDVRDCVAANPNTPVKLLPVAEDGISKWYPPEFLPRDGKGILFLDELNMAPPAMQGVAQQLILDRRVGSYTVPEGWHIWAAGNRKEDRATVFDMPAPLANRFLHLQVEPDFESFKVYALAAYETSTRH